MRMYGDQLDSELLVRGRQAFCTCTRPTMSHSLWVSFALKHSSQSVAFQRW